MKFSKKVKIIKFPERLTDSFYRYLVFFVPDDMKNPEIDRFGKSLGVIKRELRPIMGESSLGVWVNKNGKLERRAYTSEVIEYLHLETQKASPDLVFRVHEKILNFRETI